MREIRLRTAPGCNLHLQFYVSFNSKRVTEAAGNEWTKEEPRDSALIARGATARGAPNELWARMSVPARTSPLADLILALTTRISAARASVACGLTTVKTTRLSCSEAEPAKPGSPFPLPPGTSIAGAWKTVRSDWP